MADRNASLHICWGETPLWRRRLHYRLQYWCMVLLYSTARMLGAETRLTTDGL